MKGGLNTRPFVYAAMHSFVLVHSPLVGPYTWAPVADQLREKGVEAIVPALPPAAGIEPPYWERQADTVAGAIRREAPRKTGEPVILVGHSGAGWLLPAIGMRSPRPVAGYIFVDADVPEDGKSRLERFAPEDAAAFRQSAVGGILPLWAEDDLREVIPGAEARHRLLAELRHVPLSMYEERIPVPAAWPDAPCGFIAFHAGSHYPYERARLYTQRAGWMYTIFPGAHFHMLVDPPAVAVGLLRMAGQMTAKPDKETL